MESSFLTRDQTLSLWSGNTHSKTLEYQRTNPGGIKCWELTQREPLEYKTLHHPTTSSTHAGCLIWTTNKTKIQTQSSADGSTISLSLAYQENKQTNKNSAQISPYMKLTQATGPILGGKKPKERKNSIFFNERLQLSLKLGKRRPQTQWLLKKEKAEKYCTNEGTN